MATSPTNPVSFVVYGIPAPQAGTRAVQTAKGPRQISTGGVRLESWRNDCAAAARKAAIEHGPFPFGEPLAVTAEFRFPMPKSRPKSTRLFAVWPKTSMPDLDKLQRALGDSLKAGGLIRDDSLIVEWRATKYEVWEQWTGVAVTITSAATS